jgi:hypothetical protein
MTLLRGEVVADGGQFTGSADGGRMPSRKFAIS